MVATRSGARVCSSNTAEADETQKNMDATPSGNGRRRRRAAQGGTSAQSEVLSASQDDEEVPPGSLLRSSATRRDTKTAQRQDHNAPQLDSTHEADVSESESCCSEMSDRQNPPEGRVTRSRRRRTSPRQTTRPRRDGDAVSEADSVSSSVSATREPRTQRVTRSQRKSAMASRSAKQHTEEHESEPDSCSSNVSGLQSTVVRRTTRNRKFRAITPIPMSLGNDANSDVPPTVHSTRVTRAKQASTSETAAFDSEGFESGPSRTPRKSSPNCVSTRSQGRILALPDSGSESTDACSSLASRRSTRTRGTPCSSRTGSANSNRAVSVPQVRREACGSLVEAPEAVDVAKSVHLENSLIKANEQEKTLTAEDVDGLSSEKTVEAQVLPEVAPANSDKVTLLDSATEEKKDNEAELSDTAALTESSLVKAHQEEEANSIGGDVGMKEGYQMLDDTSSVVLNLSNQSVKLILSESDQKAEKESEDTKILLEEPTDNGAKEADHHKIAKKPCLILLDSSEDEDDSEDGRSGQESESDGDNMDSDGENQNSSSSQNQAGPSKREMPMPCSGLFVIDTQPGLGFDKYYLDEEQEMKENEVGEDDNDMEEDQDAEEFVDEEEDDDDSELLFKSKNKASFELSSSIDPGLKVKEYGGLYINFDGKKSKGVSDSLKKLKEQKNQDELLKKSVIGPDFEKRDAIPPYKESQKKLKVKRREEREKTTGDGWFNMKAPELTEELKHDLRALKMRSAMDPKRFYKKNDRDGFPKYLQVGTVVDSPVDFYHARIPKKQRKRTIVEELLSDAEFRSYNKKKYREIMAEKAAMASGRKKHRNLNKSNKKKAGKPL
ncbi:deoxynucleotidyltransferase terminal-interacting protein 2 [Brienomyrus brachyistius]|uniref:deoxynucleotidyltransferase terminal-interacting protein 2 n=1 Tax=Brienomyrus brachyistius TaxID=42636 RepID=UPI0020B44C69|nr:deoxynucleotidyltransferase terminal-interacting protein 2 [Brienomyrus brachyistius]